MEGSKQANASSSRNKGNKQKISLENYIDFLSSPKQSHLTRYSLNQIVSIHGFKKVFRVPREEIRDALETLDLIDPSRSTLSSSISPCAALTLEEIIRDLNLLQWQDCCVTSIRTLNSLPEQQSHSVTKEKVKRKRNRRVADVAEPLNSPSPVTSQLITKKTRRRRITDLSEGEKTSKR